MNYKNYIIKKSKLVLSFALKIAAQSSELAKVLARNDSYIIADVSFNLGSDFKQNFYFNVGRKITPEEENQIVFRKPDSAAKRQKHLRVFFNATDEDLKILKSSGIQFKKSPGTSAQKAGPMAKEFQYVINDTPLLFSLLKDPSFHLGANYNYKAKLHPTEQEKKLWKDLEIIDEQGSQIDNPEEKQNLRQKKREILDKLNVLEEARSKWE